MGNEYRISSNARDKWLFCSGLVCIYADLFREKVEREKERERGGEVEREREIFFKIHIYHTFYAISWTSRYKRFLSHCALSIHKHSIRNSKHMLHKRKTPFHFQFVNNRYVPAFCYALLRCWIEYFGAVAENYILSQHTAHNQLRPNVGMISMIYDLISSFMRFSIHLIDFLSTFLSLFNLNWIFPVLLLLT